METAFAAVDTLSFSIWIALTRIVLFSVITPFAVSKLGKQSFRFSKAAVGYAALPSVIAGSTYVMTLFTNTALPIVVTSPLSTGLGIIMGAILPRIVYREHLSKKQMIGVGLSLVGALLFLIG